MLMTKVTGFLRMHSEQVKIFFTVDTNTVTFLDCPYCCKFSLMVRPLHPKAIKNIYVSICQ